MKTYYVYILASGFRCTLYIGVTDNLIKRTYQHKNKQIKGFTKKYNVDIVVLLSNHLKLYSSTRTKFGGEVLDKLER